MARRGSYVFGRAKPRYGRRILLSLLVVLALALTAVTIYNFGLSHQVGYIRQSVTVPNLPGDLENWTILHMSDLHGRYISDNHAAIKSAIGTKACSSVVLSGDMVGEGGDVQPLLDLIALLPAGTPVMYLPGDSDPDITVSTAHSSLSVYADWVVQLQDAGVIILDEPVSFTRNKSTIWFIPEYLYTLDVDSTEAAYQAQIDLGGIANGYAADRIADLLAREGYAYGYFSCGSSSMRLLKSGSSNSKKSGDPAFSLQVRNPRKTEESGDAYAMIRAMDQSLSSSGDYDSNYTAGGSVCCHICCSFCSCG